LDHLVAGQSSRLEVMDASHLADLHVQRMSLWLLNVDSEMAIFRGALLSEIASSALTADDLIEMFPSTTPKI
ncbi:hypothetical protein, partial [Synechococcus sp. RedBA-s]|uniref:hypothetical protein n=1 Tax=Synechococcus sp. RedBA-s TaxID=2823741 RepID=UPI0020CC0F82